MAVRAAVQGRPAAGGLARVGSFQSEAGSKIKDQWWQYSSSSSRMSPGEGMARKRTRTRLPTPPFLAGLRRVQVLLSRVNHPSLGRGLTGCACLSRPNMYEIDLTLGQQSRDFSLASTLSSRQGAQNLFTEQTPWPVAASLVGDIFFGPRMVSRCGGIATTFPPPLPRIHPRS